MLFNEVLDVSLKHSQTASWTLLVFVGQSFPRIACGNPIFLGGKK